MYKYIVYVPNVILYAVHGSIVYQHNDIARLSSLGFLRIKTLIRGPMWF